MSIIIQEEKNMTKLLTVSEITNMLANQKFVDFGATNVIIIQDPIVPPNQFGWVTSGKPQMSPVEE
jgi:hypothetical protein